MHTAAAERVSKGSPKQKKWTADEIQALFELPFNDLLFQAQQVHRAHFDANSVQRSTLLSVKTGGCSEDCGYCSQAARHHTGLEKESLLEIDEVVAAAQAAKEKGASRFCMGAAWRGPKDKDLEQVSEMIRAVKALGLETCVTLGMLKEGQAEKLKAAGLIAELANMNPPPESVPINNLVPVPGTPLANAEPIDPFEFVRTIAAARITMPTSLVRLSAGRQEMSDELQALCFLAGANSIFYGDKLLTTGNPEADRDERLFERLGLNAV